MNSFTDVELFPDPDQFLMTAGLEPEFRLDGGDHGVAGRGADIEQQALLLIEANQRRRFIIVGLQTVADGRLGLVLALDHRAAAFVADSLLFGRAAFDIIDGLAFVVGAGPAGRQAIQELDDLASSTPTERDVAIGRLPEAQD